MDIDCDRLPVVLEATSRHASRDLASLLDWCGAHQERIRTLLHSSGAVLFRGFDVENAEDFARVARAAANQPLTEYVAGVARRKQIGDGIYTSTEYPPHVLMPCHNELSHTREWVSLIFFYCAVAPEDRGETPLVDGRRVLRRMRPATVAAFKENGVEYVRYLHCGDGSGVLEKNVRVLDDSGYPYSVSWQRTYGTTDKTQIEAKAREVGAEITWTKNDDLVWRERVPAIRRHPVTGEECWFNHVVNFHPSRMPAGVRARVPEEEYPRNVRFGDGTIIDDSLVEEIRSCMNRGEVLFPWQRGDVLMIDNMLVSHGRRTFEGPRSILTAMAGPQRGAAPSEARS